MASVTTIISRTKQPYGGYLRPKDFTILKMDDFIRSLKNKEYTMGELWDAEEENIPRPLIGTTVEHLVEYLDTKDKEKAFAISALGLEALIYAETSEEKRSDYLTWAEDLFDGINGLDDDSIKKAVQLSAFDVCYRSGVEQYVPSDSYQPNEKTIVNIRIMVERSLAVLDACGSIVAVGTTFSGAYTKKIDRGDLDFLTKTVLWDMKVTVQPLKTRYTLQLLVYYIMGKHTGRKVFNDIKSLGIINPRLGVCYLYPVDRISPEVIAEVERNVIGY